MEHEPIFEKFDWNQLRRGKFQGKRGNFVSLARIIYNGLSYNFGSKDGAVTIGAGFQMWRFIAPVDRFVMADYADMTLREAMEAVAEETKNVSVPAWDEFFAFLGSNEDLANTALTGYDVVRVGGVKVKLPPIKNVTDFYSFTHWLTENISEAENAPASAFIDGQDMIIPLDMYSSVPVSATFKTPTRKPEYKKDVDGGFFVWGKFGGISDPVFIFYEPHGAFIYSFVTQTDSTGATAQQGWNMVDAAGNILPYDMDANPITFQFEGGAEMTDEQLQILKTFADLGYDESQEVYDGTITFMFRA